MVHRCPVTPDQVIGVVKVTAAATAAEEMVKAWIKWWEMFSLSGKRNRFDTNNNSGTYTKISSSSNNNNSNSSNSINNSSNIINNSSNRNNNFN